MWLQAIDFEVIGTIKPITMMSLGFLLQHGEAVAKGGMKDMIEVYHKWRTRIDKK